ncbi:5'/3'-nucleotidase SurE [Acidisoma sp. 7E03]
MTRFARLLLTNDDGFDAPGIQVLERVALSLADEVWIVAPDHDQSGVSHALSLHSPLRVTEHGVRRFSVSGTPGDCVAMAARRLMPAPPDLVLSGINRGANLGVETVFSGTVGAAMTALLLGLPAMALSQAFTDRAGVPWATAEAHAATVITQFAGGSWSERAILNINFPDCGPDAIGPVTLTRQGAGLVEDLQIISGTDPRQIDYHWLKIARAGREDEPGTEAHALRDGRIAVTPLQFERTSREALIQLQAEQGQSTSD